MVKSLWKNPEISGKHQGWIEPLVFYLGGLGVYFFFVLSGFLITYLLMSEKHRTGTVAVGKFYIRRILRIWPLYYLVILLGFFVFPHIHVLEIPWLDKHFDENFFPALVLCLLMLPNLALSIYPAVPHVGQVWSIGVEEQFYLLWPLIVRFSNRLLRTIIILFSAIIAFKMIVLYLSFARPSIPGIQAVKAFVAMSKIECMAIGGMGAYVLFFNYERFIRTCFHPITQLIAYVSLPLLIYFTPAVLQDGIHLVYSFAFIVIIMNVAANSASILKLENPVFNFLGNISYGLYMYHMVIIVLVIRLTGMCIEQKNSLAANVSYYVLSVLLTILISWLSFRYFESAFNRKRKKFSIIDSEPTPQKEE